MLIIISSHVPNINVYLTWSSLIMSWAWNDGWSDMEDPSILTTSLPRGIVRQWSEAGPRGSEPMIIRSTTLRTSECIVEATRKNPKTTGNVVFRSLCWSNHPRKKRNRIRNVVLTLHLRWAFFNQNSDWQATGVLPAHVVRSWGQGIGSQSILAKGMAEDMVGSSWWGCDGHCWVLVWRILMFNSVLDVG